MLYNCRYLSLIFFCIMLVLTSESGCVKKGSIESFTILPSNICEGETITISWTALGRVELSASPASNVTFSSTGPQPAAGSMTATVRDDADIVITASGSDGSSTRSQHIRVLRSGDLYRMGASGSCSGSRPVWSVVNAPADFSDRLRVDIVANAVFGEPITVSHSGRTVSLPPAGPAGRTAEFSGTLLEGDWLFNKVLIPNPCLAERTGALAAINVEITVTCGP